MILFPIVPRRNGIWVTPNSYLVSSSLILCPFRFLQYCQFVNGVSVDDCRVFWVIVPVCHRVVVFNEPPISYRCCWRVVIFISSRQTFGDIQQYFGFHMGSRQTALQLGVSPLAKTHLLPFHLCRSLLYSLELSKLLPL